MERVEPKVFLVAVTQVEEEGLQRYLDSLGVGDWETDAPTDVEKLVELMSRGCYMSYASEETTLTKLNPNLKKTRVGNKRYLDHIINIRHGSVIEHGSVSFMFTNVSRVFTHEICRHRVGVAISQQSLRFVRLNKLKMWWPPEIANNPEALAVAEDTIKLLENVQLELARILDIENASFAQKKKITSAMRRLAPIGLATQIGWTANFRTLRHVLEMRTHPAAEIEIRKVFAEVGYICMERFPNMFGDYTIEVVDEVPWFKTVNAKV